MKKFLLPTVKVLFVVTTIIMLTSGCNIIDYNEHANSELKSENVPETYKGKNIDTIYDNYDIYVPCKEIFVEPKFDSDIYEYLYIYNDREFYVPDEQIREDIDGSTNYSIIVEIKTGEPISYQNYAFKNGEIQNLLYDVDRIHDNKFPVELKYYDNIVNAESTKGPLKEPINPIIVPIVFAAIIFIIMLKPDFDTPSSPQHIFYDSDRVNNYNSCNNRKRRNSYEKK